MKILVTYPLSPEIVESGLGHDVIYRPEIINGPEETLRQALVEHRPLALLVNGNCPGPQTLAGWRERAGRPVELVRCQKTQGSKTGIAVSDIPPGIRTHRVPGQIRHLPSDLRALALAERGLAAESAARRLTPLGISADGSGSLRGSTVTLVGAGIVNLMTAVELVERGAELEILDARPDPRTAPSWQRLGATHGGGNARMFCFTEADNYNEKGHLVYAKMHQVFRQTVSRGGWLAVDAERLQGPEQAWIDRFHALPRWRAEIFTEDIHRFTIASYPLWQRLQRDAPQLFEDVGYAPGILRLYAEREKAEAAEVLHGRLGSLIRSLDRDELVRLHPACRDAVEDGQIARGLEVRGFTLNIHDFVVRLLAHLEARGARLLWNRPVRRLERSADGLISGLRTDDGVVRSEHYVLSPGVYGGSLLEGTRSADKIQGILGLWLAFPNLEPRLRHSIKLHREGHVGEDSNVTLGRDEAGRPSLFLGSGYGYLGSRDLDMASPEIQRLFEALEETARRYFPAAYARALEDGTLAGTHRACVRPFTCTGLGVLEALGTEAGGRLVVAAGHNTGGFAQAPAVAEAVGATLEGKSHPMQALYDPERGILPDSLMD